MKLIIIFNLLLSYYLPSSFFETQENAEVKIVIQNLKDTKGEVFIGLYDNENDFPKPEKIKKGFKVSALKIKNGFSFKVPKGKKYAFALFHDENGNEKLDKNSFGVPKEGYAFSNNSMGTFGPPSFEEASFMCNSSYCIQRIEIRY